MTKKDPGKNIPGKWRFWPFKGHCIFGGLDGFLGVRPARERGEKHEESSKDVGVVGGKWAVGVSANVLEKAALRAELEYGDTSASYTEFSGRDNGDPHSNEDRAGQIDSKTLFLNFYFDIDTGTIFTPYIGAGLGVHNAALDYNFKSGRYSIPETRTSDWKFAWNVGAGVGVRVTQNLTLDLGYRYSDLGSFGMTAGLYKDDYNNSSTWREKEEHFDYDLKAHEVLLGLRYTF